MLFAFCFFVYLRVHKSKEAFDFDVRLFCQLGIELPGLQKVPGVLDLT